jgi:hypothetical protein
MSADDLRLGSRQLTVGRRSASDKVVSDFQAIGTLAPRVFHARTPARLPAWGNLFVQQSMIRQRVR